MSDLDLGWTEFLEGLGSSKMFVLGGGGKGSTAPAYNILVDKLPRLHWNLGLLGLLVLDWVIAPKSSCNKNCLQHFVFYVV